MSKAEQSGKDGEVVLSDDVLTSIIGMAVSKVEGAALLGKNPKKSVSVDADGDRVAITLQVSIQYGLKIPEVCETLRKEVQEAVNTMTGMTVSAIHVHVQELTMKKE
jgi:uncharacterized alkaline shock family protein YloU